MQLVLGDDHEPLRERVNRVLDAGALHILVDLSKVPYIDSAGLGELVRCYTAVSSRGGTLKLKNTSQRTRDLLARTDLETLLLADDNGHEAEGMVELRIAAPPD